MKNFRSTLLGLEVAACSLPTVFLIFPLWYWLWLGAIFDEREPKAILLASLYVGPVLGGIALFRYWALADQVRSSKGFFLRWYDFVALISGVAFFATVRLFVESWSDPVVPTETLGYFGALVPSPAIAALLFAASFLHRVWLASRRLITVVIASGAIAAFGLAAEWSLRQVPGIDGPTPLLWTEAVALRSGETIVTERSVTENRKIHEQVIAFTIDRRQIEWKLSQSPRRLANLHLPLILDVFDGAPVIVYPVNRAEPCKDYDYPPEGLVAFRSRNGQWSRMAIGDLPADLKVNLLTSTHEIRYGHHYKAVTVKTKSNVEDRAVEIKQGMSLEKLIWHYSNDEYACAVYKPTPDPLYEGVRDTIAAAEKLAPSVTIELFESSSELQKLTERDFVQNIGTHTNGGYVRSTCDGIVEALEPYYVKRELGGTGYNIGNVGYRIVPMRGTTGLSSVPVVGPAVEGSKSVACDANAIYAIRQPDRRTLVIHRFSHGGQLIDANRIDLGPISASLLDNPKSWLWNVSPSTDSTLLLTFAVIEPNWFLGQRATVRAVLPSPPNSQSAP
jgi:hypothetical protein